MWRMHLTLRITLLFFTFLAGFTSFAQKKGDNTGCKPAQTRILFHDYIDREQKNTLKSDGRADAEFHASNDENLNYSITQALVQKVDNLQCAIEKDTTTSAQRKVTYLRGIERLLRNFTSSYRSRRMAASNLPAIIDAYEAAIAADRTGASVENIIQKASYDVGSIVMSSTAFDSNSGARMAKNIILSKYMFLHPEKIFPTLKDNPDLPNRDSLIIVASYKSPKKLYDYAAANNKLSVAIKNIDDSLVRTVYQMAKSNGSGQHYFPFLDNIMRGRQSLAQIDSVKNDPAKYYKLLVKTRIDYINRIINQRDTAREMESLGERLQKKGNEAFIGVINGLHEEPDAKRFAVLQQLNAQELYYLVVYGENEMYTSSYVKGIFPLMMQKIGNRGDSLLMTVGFDRFKKFIRVAAGYNTLGDFLKSFPNTDLAERLMTAFVNGLEKTTTLEDGVDVADSYASIAETIKPLAAKMLENVKANYDRNVAQNNSRGTIIYNLLYKLFLSADSSNKIDLSKEFGIPPVYTVSYASLLTGDSAEKVVQQVFFYGDADGKMNYQGFLPAFANGNWKKIVDTKYYIAFASTKGKPMVVYANKWKDDDKEPGELEEGQRQLAAYLQEKGIQPTVVVHRGHSYWVDGTIEQIQPSAKIVLLGSCGGYNVISKVLVHAPDAHIIASKQTGKMKINQPFLDIMNEKLRVGSDIAWIPFWAEFKAKAGKIEGFEDYIPPYKNLGALFIKAYNSQTGTTEDREF
ncbi:MAG: hypothetical protein JWP88_1194 [Flaviaesturariibacter sp.]|nr:hypothetical protein [Flaviaesturariibacter sp.]